MFSNQCKNINPIYVYTVVPGLSRTYKPGTTFFYKDKGDTVLCYRLNPFDLIFSTQVSKEFFENNFCKKYTL